MTNERITVVVSDSDRKFLQAYAEAGFSLNESDSVRRAIGELRERHPEIKEAIPA